MDEHRRDSNDAAERRRVLSSAPQFETFQPSSAVVKVEFGSDTRPAPHRAASDDHFLIVRLGRHQEVVATSLQASDLPSRFDEYGYAMVVADGLGNRGSGALASRVAISSLAHLALHYGNWNLRVDARTADSIMNRAEFFYERAARAVNEQRLSEPVLGEICTTLTMAFSAGDQLFYAHVGHSRAYLFREGELTQLTRDHTLDQRIKESLTPVAVPRGTKDLRQILTDALGGGRGSPVVDVERIHVHDNDTVLLCTDGLTGFVDDETIADVLANPRSLNDQCRQLVNLAFDADTDDDVTVVLAKYAIPNIDR